MFDCFHRKIDYLRISVTDQCNLRCQYCMPEEGIVQLLHKDILTFDEIVSFATYAASRGITKIKLTGGEPLVRKGIVKLVEMLAKIPGIIDFGMTTNGILLPLLAKDLKSAGLQRVNISLDTINPVRYREITRGGNLSDVVRGIDAAIEAGLTPVKLNCVIEKSEDEPDALGVKKFAQERGLQLRYIPKMDLEQGLYGIVHGGEGGNCAICNRLRLTANGDIKPCLFSDLNYNIRKLGIKEAFSKALINKPRSGKQNHQNLFYNIGG